MGIRMIDLQQFEYDSVPAYLNPLPIQILMQIDTVILAPDVWYPVSVLFVPVPSLRSG